MHKKLYRSRENKVFAGVMGGLGEYFDVDPVIFRLGYLFIVILSAVIPGIIIYIIAALLVPEAPMIATTTPVRDDAEKV